MTCNQDGKPCLSDAEAMNAKWEIAREIIRNENQLVTDRMTSFLTLQGFLFTALVFGSSALANDATRDYRWLLLIVLCAVCCLGFISPRLVSPGLRAAFRHIDATKEWWKSYLENCDDYRMQHPFPVLIGRRANSFGFILFLKKRDLDEPYDDLGLDEDARKRIGIRYDLGLHRIPDFLTWMWLSAIVVYVTTFSTLAIRNWQLKSPVSVTTIKISQGANSEDITLTYNGDSASVEALVRRLTAIPSKPSTQSNNAP